jgi:hypothetical protein
MGFSGVHSDRGLTSEIHQCEMCARWTHDGAFVGEGSNGADEHFVCHRCEREANNNSFLRAAIDRWERRRSL